MSATPPATYPGQARAKFNIRFNDNHTQETLRALVRTDSQSTATGSRADRMGAVELHVS